MIHTSMAQNCTVFLFCCELTSHLCRVKNLTTINKFDSHKWPIVLVDEVKRKPRNFKASLCRSLYSTFTTSFYPHAFYNKWLQNGFQKPTQRIQGIVFLESGLRALCVWTGDLHRNNNLKKYLH